VRKYIWAILFLAALVVPSTSKADTITIHGINQDGGMMQQVSVQTVNGNVTEWAGNLKVDWNTQTFMSYCVDLFSTVYVPGSEIVTPRPIGELGSGGNPLNSVGTPGGAVGWLYNTYQVGGLVTNTAQAAGLQVAIWEVIYDSSRDLSAGSFYLNDASASGNYRDYAQQYLTALGSNTNYNAVWLDQTNGQNQAYGQDLIGPTIPEPQSLLLFGLGLVGVARRFRRRT
jgi:hypothetical protein